jgi:hypothetical protein
VEINLFCLGVNLISAQTVSGLRSHTINQRYYTTFPVVRMPLMRLMFQLLRAFVSLSLVFVSDI